METLIALDNNIVMWINECVGNCGVLDSSTELLASDYFVPVLIGLILLALWFTTNASATTLANQRAVIVALVALGLANLVVLLITDFYFRPRPFVDLDINLLFYEPTDSSFPANPTALSTAASLGVWQNNRKAGSLLIFISTVWSLARLYSGVFYLSDIASAALIGGLASYLASFVIKKMEPIPTLAIKITRMLHLS